MLVTAVMHASDCRGPDVRWRVVKTPADTSQGLTADESATLRRISVAAQLAAKHEWLVRSSGDQVVLDLKVQTHVGECVACGGSHVDHGVLVTIPWADRVLSREYLL